MSHLPRPAEDSRKRNMDRRRETSRYAARDRRAKESDIYDDLKDVVPVVEEPTVTHVDRIALLRVAATVCRFRKNAGNALTTAPMSVELLNKSTIREKQDESPWNEETLAECLDGFIIIADSDGVILYVTESVSIFLGLTQTDFAGRHLKDFCNVDDYKEYMAIVQDLTAHKDSEEGRIAVVRIKSVISPRGRNLNLKSALFKPVSFTVRVLPSQAGHCTLLQGVSVPAGQGTVSSTANAISKGSDSPSGTFMTRHTCDMRISYVSDALNGLLKADSRSLMGASFYDLVYPADVDSLRKCIRELLEKGHTRTPYYRLLTASGAVAWVLTEGTTISHTTRGQKGQYIICIHHLLGQQTEKECEEGAREGLAAGTQVHIKQEIEDRELSEYMGRQPEVMECIDFCPLIGDTDMGVYTEVSKRRPRGVPSYSTPTEDVNAPSRKKSYEEVLQWLFRDTPECPAPERTTGGGRTWNGVGQGDEHQRHNYGHSTVQTRAPAAAPSQFAAPAFGGRVGGGGMERAAHSGQPPYPPHDEGLVSGVRGPMHGLAPQQPRQRHNTQQIPSPQNTLSSCFNRACDLSSPQDGITTSPSPPLSASTVDRPLRANDVHYSATDARRVSGFPQTGAFPLSNTAEGRRGSMHCDKFIPSARTDVFSSVPASGLPSSPSLEASRGGETRRGYPAGTLINNCSLTSSSPLGLDDSSDLSCYAPFIDPGMDMQPLGEGLPKELASLLDIPSWVDCDGLMDPLSDAPLYPPRDSPPNKKTLLNDNSEFDDWPRWLEN